MRFASTDSSARADSAAETASGPPVHVAIIMDGNGRWALERGMARVDGHRQGVDAVREAIDGALEHGVRHLTLYAFSTENWNRPPGEIRVLMSLLQETIREGIGELGERQVRIRFIGDRDGLSPEILAAMEEAEVRTSANTRLDVVIGLNYGGRQELLATARRLAFEVREGRLDPRALDAAAVEARLMTAGLPDPDLVIRTGGEYRLSNFLLWQVAYAELYFSPVYWPDFRQHHFSEAVGEFRRRRRRYGQVDG